jgi:DNA-binding CsgD family transcriptional regulator
MLENRTSISEIRSREGEFPEGRSLPNAALSEYLSVTGKLAIALCGKEPVPIPLEALRHALEAEKAVLVRYFRRSENPRVISDSSRKPAANENADILPDLSEGTLDAPAGHPNWIKTGHGAFALVKLRSSPDEFDFFILRFRRAPRREIVSLANAFSSALADLWPSRKSGLANRLIADHPTRNSGSNRHLGETTILGLENAFGLSRSEFRVCSLLDRGLRPKQIAEEMGLSIATVRSHLRGVYAKTELTGQFEVVQRLGREHTNAVTASPGHQV